MDNTATIDTIKACADEVDKLQASIKAGKEMLDQLLENMPEFADLMGAKDEVATAEAKLKEVLLRNPQYNNQLEQIAIKKEALKEERDILSNALLLYYRQTGERQVEVTDHDAREVILTGKLGKHQKYQTSMFKAE